MLSYLRGKTTSKLVLGFVGVIMLAFAFAGVNYRSMASMASVAAIATTASSLSRATS